MLKIGLVYVGADSIRMKQSGLKINEQKTEICIFHRQKEETRNITINGAIVVYFDQRTHACACVRMVENDQNHCKMSEKVHNIHKGFITCIAHA